MSDVIKFPHQKIDETTRRHVDRGSFSLSSLVEGAMSAEIFKERPLAQLGVGKKRLAERPPRSKGAVAGTVGYDWTNQELATLFRINRLLNLAELTIETDRGVTDENDPWFVFLDSKGEVFVHLCRIGDRYLLDSPCQRAVVEGHSLNDLVEAYVKQMGMAHTSTSRVRHNIVQLANERGRKVEVHPAAALAALIWTIYLQSDELSAAILSDDERALEAAADLPSPPAFFEAMDAGETATFALAEEAALLSTETRIVLDSDPDHAEKSVLLTTPANYVGIGLSALALTYGLDPFIGGTMVETKSLTTGNVDDRTKVSTAEQKSLEVMLLSISGADWNILQEFGEHSEGIWSSFLDFDLFANSLVSPQVETIASELMQAMEITVSLLTSEQLSQTPLLALKVGSEVFSSMRSKAYPLEDEGGRDLSEMVLADASQLKEAAYRDEASAINMPESHIESSYVLSNPMPSDIAAVLEEHGFSTSGNIITNVTAQEYLAGFKETSAKSSSAVAASDEEQNDKYDQNVSDFISFLMINAEDVQMISYETELVIIDEATLHHDSSLTYMKSWDLDDGGRISTIGLKADFAAFDLIA